MKKSYLVLFLSTISIAFSILLCALKIPGQIPVLFDFQEKIFVLATKWFLSVFWVFTIILCIINLKVNKTLENKFLMSTNFALVYVNIFLSAVLCFSAHFSVGEKLELTLSTIFGLPLAFVVVSIPHTLKTAKFNKKFAIRTKYALKNEFLWSQTQIIAYEKLKPVCLILFLLSLIFSPFRLFYVELAVFVVSIAITFLIIFKDCSRIYNKYEQMQERKNKLDSAKTEKN